jgi:MFS family permease
MHNSEPQPPKSGFWALMQNRAFVNLWVGQIISQIADKVFFVLLIALVAEYQVPGLRESTARTSVMVANTLPAIILGSAAGVFVDRWSKRQLLWSSNFFRGLLVLLIPFLPKLLIFLLIVAILESILTQFFAPAEQAAIPILVERQTLMPANALFTTTMMGALVVGFAIGDPLLRWTQTWGGSFGREILVGGLYILAAAVLAIVPISEKKEHDGPELHPWRDFKQGLKYLKTHKLLRQAIVQITVLYSVFAALIPLALSKAERIGFKGTEGFYMVSATGIGLILGAGILGNWGVRLQNRFLPAIGFVLMGILLLIFSAVNETRFLDPLLLLSVGIGICAAMIGVPTQTLIQVHTPAEMRGKVFGVQNNVVNIALSLPLAIAGVLADIVGVWAVLVAMGIIVISISYWSWRYCPIPTSQELF